MHVTVEVYLTSGCNRNVSKTKVISKIQWPGRNVESAVKLVGLCLAS